MVLFLLCFQKEDITNVCSQMALNSRSSQRTYLSLHEHFPQYLQFKNIYMIQRTSSGFVKSRNSQILLVIMIAMAFCLNTVESNTVFKVYPLANDYFEKIYVVNHNNEEYFLTIACKEQNMLSLSLTKEKDFQEAPRFNIFGNVKIQPKMARGVYTFLEGCHCHVEVNTSNFLQVKRFKDSETIFALSEVTLQNLHNRFIVQDQSVKWGLGERFQNRFQVADGMWTIWNRDKPWVMDEGSSGVSQQTYGHHPIYLARERVSKLYHIVYFKNTHGLLVQSSENSDKLVYNSVGGNIHFIIILGQADPEELLEKYHDYIGISHIPPFWSLGYHQCRWGYRSLQEIKEVVSKFNQHDIPLDTMWSDLEYMHKKMIFTINEETHPSSALNQFIKKEGLHFVPLIDVGVSVNDKPAIKMGKEMDIFLKNNINNPDDYFTGEVWPGAVYFVDYLHPNATAFWKNQLARLYEKVKFSGIWLDMNEPSNFKGGEYVEQPYRIQQEDNINVMTINVQLQHFTQMKQKLEHREVHAYYGHLSTVPTHQFLAQYGRPFIISRSSSVGSGHFAGHWTGDNVANWDFLRASINGNFLFQIFGTQMVGADICGFYRDTTEQLCSRWTQLGSFYPFARNHNHEQSRGQEPYQFGQILLKTAQKSLKTRYALLKQLYTLLLMKKGKGSFFRPLTFEFYSDEEAYKEETIQTQFLIGKQILVAPIVRQGQVNRVVYFPGDAEDWYQFEINSQQGKVESEKIQKFSGKTRQNLQNPLPSAPLTFLRGGYSLLTNYPENRSSKLSKDFHLFVSLKNDESFGQILAINDYNNEAYIEKCISYNCLMVINTKKIGDNSFKLSWNYIGETTVMGSLRIKTFILTDGIRRWKSNNLVEIKTSQGSSDIQCEEFKI